jgi:coniferyl-aldehyde dehydrogenase
MTTTCTLRDRLQNILAAQRAAHIEAAPVTAETRIDRLDRLIRLTCENAISIVDAIVADFGGARSRHFTTTSELLGKVQGMEHARHHVRQWMEPEPRETVGPVRAAGGACNVVRQPKGVVGIIAPWNMPFGLTVAPLTSAFAAGNRAMLKPSERAPATSELLERLVTRYFAPEELAVVTGGWEVGEAFAQLPLDHLVFTGSSGIGRRIMELASANLVPVTLELGGKSPVIVGETADLSRAASLLVYGKMLNGGQLCLAPDYALVPHRRRAELIEHLARETKSMFPPKRHNPDHTGIISATHFARLRGYLDDAFSRGAEVVVVNPASDGVDPADGLRMPLHVVLGATEEMALMQQEIFGPILPILTYETITEAVAIVRRGEKPLALYYFGQDETEEGFVLANTESGGVSVNQLFQHYVQEDLPFGGVGHSGMGAYHGRDGFLELSHSRAVYRQPALTPLPDILRPPLTPQALQTMHGGLSARVSSRHVTEGR